jgi:hypothetical protein
MNTLFTDYPLPWKVLEDPNVDGSWKITAANDDVIISSTEYTTGDGSEVYLDLDQAKELVATVNRTGSRESGPQ